MNKTRFSSIQILNGNYEIKSIILNKSRKYPISRHDLNEVMHKSNIQFKASEVESKRAYYFINKGNLIKVR